MTLRRFATVAALGIAGLAAAVGIGLLANSISGDSVGLGAEPLSAGDTLAPASVKADDEPKQRARHRKRHRERGSDDGGAKAPADSVAVPPSTGSGGTVTTFDDHGGDTSGSDDGGTSGSSGSGSSGSDSSGSGSSGSGTSTSGTSGSSGSSSGSGGSDD
jgi:hypothetical protein